MKPDSERSLRIARVDEALPQTQCGRCDYPDCRRYAEAIVDGKAAMNQCPPGGAEGIARLAAITGQPALMLSEEHGVEGPRLLALIDEAWCIGCTLCQKVCPTDAIVGANKLMHTVVSAHCTGCELCIPACPVDCIEMLNASGTATGWQAWSQPQADHARRRYRDHQLRWQTPAAPTTGNVAPKPLTSLETDNADSIAQHLTPEPSAAVKSDTIAQILAKARARRAS